MRNKFLTAIALSFALSTGAAFAQTLQEGQGESNVQQPLPGLESFHTDETMTDLRTPDDMRASFDALSAEERQALRDQCELSVASQDSTADIDQQTTASIDSDNLPPTFADLCAQVQGW